MKKLLAVVLLLSCLGLNDAYAESISTKIGVPNRVTLPEWTTASGETVITIDATVEMPDIDTLSIYQLRPRSFTTEEVKLVLECLGFEDVSAISLEPKPQDDPDLQQAYNFIKSSQYEANISNSYWKGQAYSSCIDIRQRGGKVEYFAGAGATPDNFMPEEGMEGCDYSRMEAEEMAVGLARKIAPQLCLNAKGILQGSQYAVGSTDAEIASNWDDDLVIPNACFFVFSRSVDNIPITPTQYAGGDVTPEESAYLRAYPDERLNIVISDNGIEGLYYQTPYSIQAVLQENITGLLPFEQVLEIAQATLPLRLAAQETPGAPVDRAVSISRIAFGYMKVKAQAGVFQLIPVWDFFGRETIAADTWAFESNSVMDSYLTINALDGAIMDREHSH